jgi:hypothetical protein
MSDVPDDMRISLNRCREIYKKHGYDYTDEQLIKIRDFLYAMAAIQNKSYLKKLEESKPSGFKS